MPLILISAIFTSPHYSGYFGLNTKFQQEKNLLPVDHGKLFATIAGTEQTVSLPPALRQINLNRPKSAGYPAWPARDFRCYE
jgi:hypothetical protein